MHEPSPAAPVDPSPTRRVGDRINGLYNQLQRKNIIPSAHLPPPLRYALRAALGQALIRDADSLPALRADVARYAALFQSSGESFERIVGPFTTEIHWPTGRVFNGLFDTVDAYLYYALLRTYRPGRIVEIGTGNSARFAAEALRRNGRGEIVAIDPRPAVHPPRGAVWIRSKVEDVPLAIFQKLQAGDVLFIDSSHRRSEVQDHVDRILPVLADGVLVHVHDFYYPYDSAYPSDPDRFEETQAWLDLLSAPGSSYQVITCAPFLRYERPELLTSLVPPYARTPRRVPGSLWVQKRRTQERSA